MRLRSPAVSSAHGQPRFAVMDIAAAQAAFDRIGRVDANRPAACARARNSTPCATASRGRCRRASRSIGPEATSRATERMSRSYRVNLNVLALVALFTGGLLVFSTQALSVVRRRAQFALLRTLGVTRRRLARAVCAEGALIGVAGSAVGLVAGYALALVAVRIVGADLGSGYFRGVAPALDVDPLARARVLRARRRRRRRSAASCRRSRRRARRRRARSRRATRSPRSQRLRSPWPGLVVIALGAARSCCCRRSPACRSSATPRSRCLLIGTLLLMPRIAARCSRACRRRRTRRGARARAASRRARARRRQPRDDRRQREPHGVDGDHGRVVPAVARRLARAQSCRRRLYARGRRPTARLHAGRSGAHRARLPGIARAEFLARRASAARSRRGRASCCSRAPLIESEVTARAAARRRAARTCPQARRRRSG